MENQGYAKSVAETLEAKGIFVYLIDQFIAAAEKKGEPTDIFTTWKQTREQATFVPDEDIDLGDLELEIAA